MKKFILRIFTFIAILYITDVFITGFDVKNLYSLTLFAVAMAITHFVIAPIINFLTLPINFFTYGVFNFIVSCGFLYLFSIVIYGFQLKGGYINGFTSPAITMPKVELSYIGVIIIASLTIALLNGIVNWTQD